ncbi:MAG: KH domain-containing protein [Chloroflexi bacterium]|nr:KH domain-containing protein [Chloroflexota bacterium]
MKELVEYVARAIATHPDEVKVTEEVDEEGYVVLKLEVHEDDKGKVIGRQGRVAQAMRVLLRVAAVKQDVRVTLEIV